MTRQAMCDTVVWAKSSEPFKVPRYPLGLHVKSAGVSTNILFSPFRIDDSLNARLFRLWRRHRLGIEVGAKHTDWSLDAIFSKSLASSVRSFYTGLRRGTLVCIAHLY